MHKHLYSQRLSGSVQGPWAQPPAPPDIKVDLLPRSAKQLHQESSETGFSEWQRCLLGSGAKEKQAEEEDEQDGWRKETKKGREAQ